MSYWAKKSCRSNWGSSQRWQRHQGLCKERLLKYPWLFIFLQRKRDIKSKKKEKINNWLKNLDFSRLANNRLFLLYHLYLTTSYRWNFFWMRLREIEGGYCVAAYFHIENLGMTPSPCSCAISYVMVTLCNIKHMCDFFSILFFCWFTGVDTKVSWSICN